MTKPVIAAQPPSELPSRDTDSKENFRSKYTAWIGWITPAFFPYLVAALDWIEGEVNTILGTSLAGNVPDPIGHAGKALGVPGAENGAAFFQTSISGVVGGTANDITLTTGLSLSALSAGQIFSFVPLDDSTGAVSLTIDGNALSVRTAAGGSIPAGYLKAGVLVTGRVTDDGQFYVSRVHTELTANGIVQYVNDIATVTDEITLTYDAPGALNAVWTYPVTNFADAPSVFPLYRYTAATVPQNPSQIGALVATSLTATSVTLELRRIVGETDFVSGNTAVVRVIAIGQVT